MGAPKYAAIILEDLANSGVEIALVVTQEDKPSGRNRTLSAPIVKETALKLSLPIAQPRKLDDIANDLAALKPDLIVVAAYGQMISDQILAIAPCLNLHASLLPKYRGASPIQAALLNGDQLTGLTLMRVRKALDSGEIAGFSLVKSSRRNLETLTIALAKTGAKLILNALKRYETLEFTPQNSCDASLVKKVKKEDGLIDFNRSALAIDRAFRAYYGWPGVYLESGLTLLDLEALNAQGEAGTIIAIDKPNGAVTVACKEGAVRIARARPSGKNAMSALDYINGRRLKVGDLLS
jgi:methionyl-tRNA formyltransferase